VDLPPLSSNRTPRSTKVSSRTLSASSRYFSCRFCSNHISPHTQSSIPTVLSSSRAILLIRVTAFTGSG
jgi:hypothetical protein